MNKTLGIFDYPNFYDDSLSRIARINKISPNGKLECTQVQLYTNFIKSDEKALNTKRYDDLRLLGYVLKLNFTNADIILSDEAKIRVGGVPNGSFLIMSPDHHKENQTHFILIRVIGVSATPCDEDKEHTCFEMYKNCKTSLDPLTMNELQWSALKTEIIGMFYLDPSNKSDFLFSEDINNFLSPHRYKIYSPTKELLNIIVNNGILNEKETFAIGKLKITECDYPPSNSVYESDVDVKITTKDIKGRRTALFGKTRLGKSNTVKVIAQSILESTNSSKNVGQLIFDINGEYANDNQHDGGTSLKSAFPNRCQVYSMNNTLSTSAKQLSLNFYEHPDSSFSILADLLMQKSRDSHYVESFSSVKIQNINSISNLEPNERTRAVRRIQFLWSILYLAGFSVDQNRLKKLNLNSKCKYGPYDFNPKFNNDVIKDVFNGTDPAPSNLDELAQSLRQLVKHYRSNQSTAVDKMIGNPDDMALLNFCFPSGSGSGPIILRPFQKYHHPLAVDLVNDIISELEGGMTVILDLCDSTDQIRKYFGELICSKIFYHQNNKFKNNLLDDFYVNLFFEEAHNLFPKEAKDYRDIYMRLAKESGKLNIGMLYSTQSPSAIAYDLISQTENIFVGHMSSQIEVDTIGRLNSKFKNSAESILRGKKVGYMRFITESNRFVVPVQIKKFQTGNITD
tara:strand:+ start:1239 stop:3284 length:2046 start_codon:yes stop_codon:yes gene_type:complete